MIILDIILFFIPHFVTRETAMGLHKDDHTLLIPLFDKEYYNPEKDHFVYAIARIKSLSFLGIGWFPKVIPGTIKPVRGKQ